jgi:hypothetical protein
VAVTHVKALIVLNKPAGYECSLKPKPGRGVTTCCRARCAAATLQAVGRLDQDTTGLLLMTDDGPLLHKLDLAQAPRAQGLRDRPASTRSPRAGASNCWQGRGAGSTTPMRARLCRGGRIRRSAGAGLGETLPVCA